jgi:hypothetical protein
MERWYTSDRFRFWSIALLAIVLVAQAVPVLLRDNDYTWHTDQGDLFLAGDPYGVDSGIIRGEWYPLSRAMFDVVPALMPKMVGKSLIALLALLCVGYSLRAFTKLTREERFGDSRIHFAASMFALVAMSPYLNRDLDDGGLQCLLLGMLALGGAMLWQGRSWAAGFWLGTAIAYKFTPILFLPVLLWKREGRAALALVLVALGWNLLPAAFVGWEKTVTCQHRWWQRMMVASRARDIAENGIEAPNSSNQGLMAVCARYLQTYPAGHELNVDHPLFVQFGQFDVETARLLAQAGIAVLGLAIAWGMRRAWTVRDPRLPYEWAVACIFTALISPLCWRQHLVLALPAGFLLWRSLLAAPKRSAALFGQAVVLAILVQGPQRELLGRDLTGVLLAYKLDTLALLGYTALLFRIAPISSLAPPVVAPMPVPAEPAGQHQQAA